MKVILFMWSAVFYQPLVATVYEWRQLATFDNGEGLAAEACHAAARNLNSPPEKYRCISSISGGQK